MTKRLNGYVLTAIVAVAFILRIWHLGSLPPSLTWDEVSIGYNAYSVMKTGRDEHGKLLPLDSFAAFGDYKPVIPEYVTIPFIAVFGLSEVAVRLPSAIAGTLTVFLMYMLAGELFEKSRKRQLIGLFTAGVLAITPWQLMLSRAGFEANIAVLFISLGVYTLLRARHDERFYAVSLLPFVAGISTFNSARYAGPLIGLGVVWFTRDSIAKYRKQFGVAIAVAAVALLPIVHHLLSKEARLRFNEVSIFTDLRTVLTANMRSSLDGNAWWSKVLHNRRVGYAREYAIHFFDNLEPRFLFINGDGNPKFSLQDTGELLLISAPFVAYGILALMTVEPSVALLLLWWLVASIAPAGVARETPHALRIENAVPVFMIFTGYGIVAILDRIRKVRWQWVVGGLVTILFLLNFLYFWHNYTAHYPKEYSGEWQYGYKETVEYIRSVESNYDTIVLTDNIGRPYIYLLFYEAYSPQKFWTSKDASFDAAGFYNVYGFDKYRFTKDGIGSYKGHTLYILAPKDVPVTAKVLKTFRLLNGDPVLVAFE